MSQDTCKCGKKFDTGGSYMNSGLCYDCYKMANRTYTGTAGTGIMPKDNIGDFELDPTHKPYQGQGLTGWICTKCGASLSPLQAYCPFCCPQRTEISWS